MKRTFWLIATLTVLYVLGIFLVRYDVDNKMKVSSRFNFLIETMPDFKKWPIEKEKNIDANNDMKDDFRLIYYLKDKEDAVALFMPLDDRSPKVLIFSHYPGNVPDPLGIYYCIYENSKWTKTQPMDIRINDEFKNLNIKINPFGLIFEAFLSSFNRRELNTPVTKDENGEVFHL